jgi:hypothetical protein
MLHLYNDEYCFDDIKGLYNIGYRTQAKDLFLKAYQYAKDFCREDIKKMCEWYWEEEVVMLHRSTYICSGVELDIHLIKILLHNKLQTIADMEYFKTESRYSATQKLQLNEFLIEWRYKINTFSHLGISFFQQNNQNRYVIVEMPGDEQHHCIGKLCSWPF